VLRLTAILATIAAALVGFGYLFYLNPAPVTLQLSRATQWQAPLPLIMLAAFLVGVALMLAFSLVRAGKHAVAGWRMQRRTRRARRQQARKDLGLGLAWLGELERSRATLARALRDGPDDLAAFLLFARTYLEEGDFRRARAVLEEGFGRRGTDPKLLLFLAEAQRGLGEIPAAIESLERARRADPASPRILTALRDAYAAAARWTDAAEAQEALLMAVHEPVAREEAERRLMGLRYQAALATPDQTTRVTALRALLRAHPDFEPAAVSLGDALLETGQPRLAERVWRRAVGRGARSGVLERLERLLAGGPRVHRLEALTRRLVRRRPADGTARLFRARQLIRAGQLDAAASELAQVGAPWNSLASYHALLGEVHVRRGSPEDAVTAFRQALGASALGAFRCEVCGTQAEEWRGHCERCQSWNSYRSSFEAGTSAGAEETRQQAQLPVPVLPAPAAR